MHCTTPSEVNTTTQLKDNNGYIASIETCNGKYCQQALVSYLLWVISRGVLPVLIYNQHLQGEGLAHPLADNLPHSQ